jgi:hypothetical protein
LALLSRLRTSARVTVVSGPPGSGKTVLLRSWISEEDLAERAAWAAAGRDERDPQRFWLSVVDALRRTAPGSGLVQAVTAAPDLDGWAITEQLLADPSSLCDQLWLVVNDVHELGADALRQLELLVLRAPQGLRFVLASPERFAAEFSGTERTVAEYLLAEVLDRQDEGVRRLLLARERGNLPAVAGDARRLQAMANAPDAAPGLGEDLHALALISLGITEHRTAGFTEAMRHLGQGQAFAHRIGRPRTDRGAARGTPGASRSARTRPRSRPVPRSAPPRWPTRSPARPAGQGRPSGPPRIPGRRRR